MSSILRKGVNVFLNNWVTIIIQFILGILIVRFLGVQGKGEVSILQTGAGLLSSLFSLGMSNSAAYYLRKGIYSEKKIFKSYLNIISLIVLVFFIFFMTYYEVMWRWLFDDLPSTDILFYIIFGYVVVMIFTQYFTSISLAKADLFKHRILTLGISILYVVFFLLFVIYFKLGVLGVMLSYFLAELIVCLYNVLKVKSESVLDTDNHNINKSMIVYGMKSHLVPLGNILFARLDYFFIAYYLTTKDVGIYSIAYYFYQAGLTIPLAVNGILLGEIAKDQRNSIPVLLKSCFYIFVIVAVLVLIGLLVGKYLILFIYGDVFLPAIPSFYILLLATLVMSFSSPLQSYFLGIGKPLVPGTITFLSGIIKVAALVVLIPKFGILGNAWATLISVFFITIFRIVFFTKYSKISIRELINFNYSLAKTKKIDE